MTAIDLLAAVDRASTRRRTGSASPRSASGRLHRLRRLLGSTGRDRRQPTRHRRRTGSSPGSTAALNTAAPVLQLPVDRRIYGLRLQVLTDGLIDAVHAAGKHVHVWTIDDPAEMERLHRRGCRRHLHRPDRPAQRRPDRLRPVGRRSVT